MFKLVVLSVAVAVAAAQPNLLAPLGLGWGGIAAPLVTPYAAAPLVGVNYRGPLSLAPGQPANILAADGRPLDTLSVNLDRAAHLTAKAVNGAHILKKRAIVAPWVGAPIAPLGVPGVLPTRLIAPGPVGLVAPGHIAPIPGIWGHGLLGHI